MAFVTKKKGEGKGFHLLHRPRINRLHSRPKRLNMAIAKSPFCHHFWTRLVPQNMSPKNRGEKKNHESFIFSDNATV